MPKIIFNFHIKYCIKQDNCHVRYPTSLIYFFLHSSQFYVLFLYTIIIIFSKFKIQKRENFTYKNKCAVLIVPVQQVYQCRLLFSILFLLRNQQPSNYLDFESSSFLYFLMIIIFLNMRLWVKAYTLLFFYYNSMMLFFDYYYSRTQTEFRTQIVQFE